MIVRRAKQEDKEAIWMVHTRAIRQTASSHYNPEQIEAWAARLTAEGYTQPIETGVFFVAEDAEGQVVGFAQLGMESGEVQAVYVHPDHGRRGVGKQLIKVLEAEARHCGLTTLHLDASLNAVAFYKQAGFIAERQTLHRLGSGTEIPCVVMTKVLA